MVYSIAFIGAGNIAKQHLEAIEEMKGLKPIAIADLHQGRANEFSLEYGLHAYTNYKEMVEIERPEIAVITLPHYLHKEAAVWCANLGCHILLEKPMALNVSECDEIMEAVKRNGVHMLVGHTQHYIAENLKAKQLIMEGNLGQLVMINDKRHLHYYQDHRPGWFFDKAKAGGGIIMNLGSHSIDKIQWLSGGSIVKVRAMLSHYGGKGDVEGSGVIFMETDQQIPATVSQSGYIGVNQDETEFVFTKGMLKLVTGQSLWISEGGKYTQVPVESKSNPFVLQFKDLIASMESGREPDCTLEYSKGIVSVIETIFRSHELGVELLVGWNQ